MQNHHAFEEYGFDLLIDEDPNVRAATIRSFGIEVNPVG